MLQYLVVSEKALSLHRLTKRTYHWRDGRVIDCSGLENRRTARYRGFESLSLRKIAKTFSDKER